uniref:TonB-dependent receptor n=2 Tax=Agrobacterium rosae TaxID=1972867 RepID=A0AAW9FJP7_9HYPH|nr:TonB-dependent receptor [Agrobacterium rosae]
MIDRNYPICSLGRASLFSLLLAGAAVAMLPKVARSQQMQNLTVDIPAGNLASALNRLATQSKLQMVFDASVTKGQKNPAIAGLMTPQQALERLLSGTGIRYRFISATTVKVDVFSPGVSSVAAEESTVLETITVKSRAFNLGAPGNSLYESGDIERAQANTLPQLLQRTPGVSTTGGVRLQGQTTTIRGFARSSDTRILLDGAPKNFELYDQGSIFVEPEILKRVEIQKGATTVRYGNGGFGGTVLMETKTAEDMLKPGQNIGAWAKTSFQSANRQRMGTAAIYGKSDFGGPITYDGFVSGTWRKSDNVRVGGGEVYDASNDRLTSFTANGGVEYDGHELRGSVVYGISDDWGPVAGIRGNLGVTQFSVDRYGKELARLRALTSRDLNDFSSTLKYAYSGDSDLVNFKAMASLSSTSLHSTRPIIAGFTPTASLGGQESEAKYSDIKLEAENTSKFDLGGVSHLLNYGVQFSRHDRDAWMYDIANRNSAQYNYGYYASWIVPEGTQDTISAFIRDDISLSDTFSITPGLRFDHVRSEGVPNVAPRYNNPVAGHDYSAVSHFGFTPALSARWEATESTTVFVDWAYAMRAPIIDEIYSSQSSATKASATSRDLSSERNNNFNIGISQQFDDLFLAGDTLTASFAGFHNHVTNPVTRRFGSSNLAGVNGPVPFYWNTPSYKIYGVELKADYESDSVFGSLGISLMNGSRKGAINDIYGGKTYPNDMSPLTANAAVGYRVPEWDLSFGWTGHFVSAQTHTPVNQGTGYFYARPESAGYAVQGLFLDWTPREGLMAGTEVHAGVENMFDKLYEPYLSDGVSAMAGRNFKLSISRKF